MTVNRYNPIVQWAYLFRTVPAETNLCKLFWGCVAITPLLLWLCIVAGLMVSAAIVSVYQDPSTYIIGAGIVSVVVCGVWMEERGAARISRSLVGQMLRAHKEQFCPIVKIDSNAR